MIRGLKVLALITARGGSKGLPGKNVRPLADKPMIIWTVEAALGSALVDRVIVSSDDPGIIAAATGAGAEAPFIRPNHLATDEATSEEVVIHALDTLKESFDVLVLLQPTSPLRTAEDVDAAIRLCIDTGAPSCISVVEPAKPPYWMYHMDSTGRLARLLDPGEAKRRQDLPTTWAANGAVFVARIPWFRENLRFVGEGTVGSPMPAERSVDIDTSLDFQLAEILMQSRDRCT